jgi:RNA polymerase sigma factor (sigma-70 family)
MDRRLLFEEILRRHESDIRRTIGSKFPNKMDADDIFQELAIHILNKLEEESDEELERWDVKGWLIRITGNFCLTELRKKNTKKGRAMKDLPDEDAFDRGQFHKGGGYDPEQDPSRSSLGVDIAELLSNLNERDRMIVILKHFEGRSVEEIDQIMDITNSAQYYKRAIERLQRTIGVERYREAFDDFFPLE